MRVTVLVSSRPADALGVAEAWARAGDAVTVVLLDAAAAAARPAHVDGDVLRMAQAAGVAVAAHDDALRRRALSPGRLAEGVGCVDLDGIADLVTTEADRAMWW